MMGMEHDIDCSNNGYRKCLDGKLKRTDDLDMSDGAAALNTMLHVEYCSPLFVAMSLYVLVCYDVSLSYSGVLGNFEKI